MSAAGDSNRIVRPIIEEIMYPARENTTEYSMLLGSHRSRDEYIRYGCISTSEQSSSGSPLNCDDFSTTTNESCFTPDEKLKRKIKYFFMNPLEKWRIKGKFPWKLVLQVIKIVFVTVQIYIFGNDGYFYEIQKQHMGSSFRHIFLKDWTPIREVVSYPPSTGPYAVYTKPEFYSNMDHIAKMYSNITNIALGLYQYNSLNGSMEGFNFCRTEFYGVTVENSTFSFDNRIRNVCNQVPPVFPAGDPRWEDFSFEKFMEDANSTIKFDCLISATVKFSLRSIFLNNFAHFRYPDCYTFDITILFDNTEHDSQIMVSLDTFSEKFRCKHGVYRDIASRSYILRQILNMFIIFVCILSLVLCIRCLYKGHVLCTQTEKYFKKESHKILSTSEKFEFFDGWYCMMVFNDCLIIAGSILKAAIEQRTVESEQYATCAILLGSGNLLVWAGVLRYLGFFRKYNILILTLKTAIPNVLRFMLCCILLYGGFCFCGWVVLGPYHIKFRTLSTASECLFAMMNGDDLFATFAITDTDSQLIWWFSRIYLYLFISIFIYVVISLFISVIMDSYETVKDFYTHGRSPSRIQALVADCTDDSCSTFYRLQLKQKPRFWNHFMARWRRNNRELTHIVK